MSHPLDESLFPAHLADRRRFLLQGSVAAGATLAGASVLHAQTRTDTEPPVLDGQPVPEPPADRSAGPVKAGRGSALGGKLAVVTASDAKPATPADLEETVRQVKAYGHKAQNIRLDIRDMQALRKAADQIESTYGKIDIVVADAAIQHWKPLLEMQDEEWRDVIDNNLNGTANTIRAFAPKMVPRRRGRIIVLSSMQETRCQGCIELLGVQVGHLGPDEVRRSRAR